jgi:DHA3 family macrolide efflux protein-like MFS transporter
MNSNWQKNTILFLTSQAISLFGSTLVQHAITWYITLKTQSGTMMTVAIICGFLPGFFLAPFAGVWADRYHRKMLIILSDALIAATTLVLAILFFSGYQSSWLLFGASVLRSLGSAVQTPAVGAFLPQLVPGDQLTRVNAINSSIQSAMMIVSPMLSAALLTMATIEAIFLIDVVTAAVAVAILLLFLHVPAHAKALTRQTTGYFEDLREGLAYIKNHGYVKTFFLFIIFFFILIAPAAFLTPLQVTRSFGNEVWRLSAIEITFSLGMMAGGLIIAAWGGFQNKVHTMALSVLANGVAIVALGFIPVFWIYLTVMAFIGVVIPVFNTPATVLLQQKVEEAFLGRVFGVMGMIASSMMPLGMLVFGPVADFIKIEWLLAGTGLLMVIQGFLMFGNQVLIEAGKPVQGES